MGRQAGPHAEPASVLRVDLLARGFEWTLKRGKPVNKAPLRYKCVLCVQRLRWYMFKPMAAAVPAQVAATLLQPQSQHGIRNPVWPQLECEP